VKRRWGAGAAALTDYVQTQEMIDAMNMPVITNCTGFAKQCEL
jgi:hypothetical protein